MKSIVVTGASSGIGKACALHLAKLGFEVFAGVRNDSDAVALCAETTARITPLHVDVTDPSTIAGAVKTLQDITEGRGLAGLVNNAGICIPAPLECIPLHDLRRQFEVNVIGTVAVIQGFLPLLRQAGGRIVNMGSALGEVAPPFLGPYSATKFALEALTDSLRRELLPLGIFVSIVEPGSVVTPIWGKMSRSREALLETCPSEAMSLYGKPFINLMTYNDREARKRSTTAEHVAEAVARALQSRRPRARYRVGIDAKLNAYLATLVPDRWMDRIFTWMSRTA
ncbi:MAG TPA: SDR family oxidoreductase [Polyangiaceae bacterium]|nr:SDR family oxidoreductase [Polyangiaceae bacterium]